MALNPNRGLPPGELPGSGIGNATLIINLGNGRQPALAGIRAKGVPVRAIQPTWWYLSSEPDGASLVVDALMKTHGSGSFATIFSGGLAGMEPSLTSPATENDGDASGWPQITATHWIEARLSEVTVGSPKQVSLTIHGVYV